MTTGSSDGISRAIDVANRIVKAQGNIFIKEFLRQKKRDNPAIRIGATKDVILANLVAAIEQGAILGSDLEAWLSDVEGWGKQHVYLYRATPKLGADDAWTSPDRLIARLTTTGLSRVWKQGTSLDFPADLTLASIDYVDGQFEMVWRRRLEYWNRDMGKDKVPNREVIDGDVYEFRAYRQQLDRSVARFVLRPRARKAALFLQIPLADPSHNVAKETVRAVLAEILSVDELKPVSVSKVIKAFDKMELDSGTGSAGVMLKARNTKFAAKGATVEFDVAPGNDAWKNVAAVRRVRRALDEDSFTGDTAQFEVELSSVKGLVRSVVLSLSAKDKRLYFPSQMTADEVWSVIDLTFSHAT
ncbi:MAG: hypothetical protein HZA59_11930 [Hydrogenophilales bacterium]|nr:hypothetical protein [Hydrogenophilales bacterium]